MGELLRPLTPPNGMMPGLDLDEVDEEFFGELGLANDLDVGIPDISPVESDDDELEPPQRRARVGNWGLP